MVRVLVQGGVTDTATTSSLRRMQPPSGNQSRCLNPGHGARRRLGRRGVRATPSAGLKARQQGSDRQPEPLGARPTVVADQGAVHGQASPGAQTADRC